MAIAARALRRLPLHLAPSLVRPSALYPQPPSSRLPVPDPLRSPTASCASSPSTPTVGAARWLA
ncbi:hypothetical protein PR202_ga16321 [Eleusine coracana subsp. coracana]|uniref:Uncharacterized protein n=1 Tax=Eleusine coracana subsp. coracana TaxID=191504 RepID=A0AAV5CMA4_ELECO|nr:hypothetical protein PR202_ga16321 [Eleusine coracana subsp. coracana]